MSDERKDLEDITLENFEHDRWIELLKKYIDVMQTKEFRVADDRWPIAGELLWVSMKRLNSALLDLAIVHHGAVVKSTKRPAKKPVKAADKLPDFTEIAASDVRTLRDVVPLVVKLQYLLPEQVSKFDSIVEHANLKRRSWLEIALNHAEFVGRHLEHDESFAGVKRAIEFFKYDASLVGLQLELEEKKFRRLEFFFRDRLPTEDSAPKTTVGEALQKFLRPAGGGSVAAPTMVEHLEHPKVICITDPDMSAIHKKVIAGMSVSKAAKEVAGNTGNVESLRVSYQKFLKKMKTNPL